MKKFDGNLWKWLLENVVTKLLPDATASDAGKVAKVQSDGSVAWGEDASLPDGGTAGQVLTKTESGAGWQDNDPFPVYSSKLTVPIGDSGDVANNERWADFYNYLTSLKSNQIPRIKQLTVDKFGTDDPQVAYNIIPTSYYPSSGPGAAARLNFIFSNNITDGATTKRYIIGIEINISETFGHRSKVYRYEPVTET